MTQRTEKERQMIEAHRMGLAFAGTCMLNAEVLFRDPDVRFSYLAGLIMTMRRLVAEKYGLTDRDVASLDISEEVHKGYEDYREKMR